MLGAPNGSTAFVPHPSNEKHAVIPRVATIAFNVFKDTPLDLPKHAGRHFGRESTKAHMLRNYTMVTNCLVTHECTMQ
jgi:hypothetical protein